ncbi:MAG: right-handed parallel beta-helix repeat-containing protein [Deltaproteobacteria bacterium]|nr:right-handed parallel beta-helix repeat-containing protein [Deltaproteobacteria bacterium]
MTRIECNQNQSQEINPLTKLGCFVEQHVLNPLQQRIDSFVQASLLVYNQFEKLVDTPPTPLKGSPHEIVLKRVENYKPWEYNRFPNITYSRRMDEAREHYTSGPIRVKPKDQKHIELPWIIHAYAEVGKLPFRAIGAFQGCNKSSGGGFVETDSQFSEDASSSVSEDASSSGDALLVPNNDGDTSVFNHPPEFGVLDDREVNEGQKLEFTLPAFDADKDTLIFTSGNLPAGASLNKNTGKFLWTPTYNQAGLYEVNFVVSDGILSDSGNMNILVHNVNQAPVDNDGDGWFSDKDCDDNDSNVKPLYNNQTYVVNHKLRVCPGTYTRAKLEIKNVQGVDVIGAGVEDSNGNYFPGAVILDGAGITADQEQTVILLNQVNQIYLAGFKIKGYHNHNGIKERGGSNNEVAYITMDAYIAIRSEDSSNNYFHHLDLKKIGLGILISGGGNMHKIENCNIAGDPNDTALLFFRSAIVLGSWSGFTEILNNNIDGKNVLLADGARANIIGNTIINCNSDGIYLDSSNNVITGNEIHNNKEWGLIVGGGDNNTITNNDLRWNEEGGLFIAPGSTGNTVFGNQE